jgi:hypothetical protein
MVVFKCLMVWISVWGHGQFKKLKSSLPECLVIWNTNPAISHNSKGGVFIPGLDYLRDSMELHILEANYCASKVAVENGHDVEG